MESTESGRKAAGSAHAASPAHNCILRWHKSWVRMRDKPLPLERYAPSGVALYLVYVPIGYRKFGPLTRLGHSSPLCQTSHICRWMPSHIVIFIVHVHYTLAHSVWFVCQLNYAQESPNVHIIIIGLVWWSVCKPCMVHLSPTNTRHCTDCHPCLVPSAILRLHILQVEEFFIY